MKITNKAAAEFGRRGGSARSQAKTDAVRMNGKLGGRPSTRNKPRETFNLQSSIARLDRIKRLGDSIEIVLTSDGEALEPAERAMLKQCSKVLARIEKRVATVFEVHQLKPA